MLDISPQPIRRLHIGADGVRRLWELGLKREHLHNAVSRGDELRRQCGPLHPKTYPGQVMWAETTAALRHQVIPSGRRWEPGSTGNYETVFSTETKIAVAVVGGDSFTGIVGFNDPSVKRKRGPMTERRVRRNRASQAPLPLEEFEELGPSEEAVHTWFLLLHARADRIYAELSLPIYMNGDGRVRDWAERILLEPLDRVGAVTPMPVVDEDDEVPSVNVVRRR